MATSCDVEVVTWSRVRNTPPFPVYIQPHQNCRKDCKEVKKNMGRKARKPTDYVWTAEREEQLLNWWEENELLYNMETKDYSNQHKKRRMYEEFAAKMGATGKLGLKGHCHWALEYEIKWNNLNFVAEITPAGMYVCSIMFLKYMKKAITIDLRDKLTVALRCSVDSVRWGVARKPQWRKGCKNMGVLNKRLNTNKCSGDVTDVLNSV